MTVREHTTVCGLPSWTGMVLNNTAFHINHILLAIVNGSFAIFAFLTINGSFAIFAFLTNLAIIITVFKKPALQKPSNILLCGLAFADSLIGVIVQPLFVVWRFFFQRAQQSCSSQILIFYVYYTLNVVITGFSFALVMVMSFDRLNACSRPLIYRAEATNKGKCPLINHN